MVPDVQNLSPEEENRPVLQCCGRECPGEQHFDLGIPGLGGGVIPEWEQMSVRPKTMACSGSQVCSWLPAHPPGLCPALSLLLPKGSREAPPTCSLIHLPLPIASWLTSCLESPACQLHQTMVVVPEHIHFPACCPASSPSWPL